MPRPWPWGWQAREQRLHWFGVSPLFRLSSRVALDLDACCARHCTTRSTCCRCWPARSWRSGSTRRWRRALGELLAGRATECAVPQREIDNPYAYRDCERWLHRQYGKKPLRHLRQARQQRDPGARHAAPIGRLAAGAQAASAGRSCRAGGLSRPAKVGGKASGGARRAAGASAGR